MIKGRKRKKKGKKLMIMFIVKKLDYVNSLSGIVLSSRRRKYNNKLNKSKRQITTNVWKRKYCKLSNLKNPKN